MNTVELVTGKRRAAPSKAKAQAQAQSQAQSEAVVAAAAVAEKSRRGGVGHATLAAAPAKGTPPRRAAERRSPRVDIVWTAVVDVLGSRSFIPVLGGSPEQEAPAAARAPPLSRQRELDDRNLAAEQERFSRILLAERRALFQAHRLVPPAALVALYWRARARFDAESSTAAVDAERAAASAAACTATSAVAHDALHVQVAYPLNSACAVRTHVLFEWTTGADVAGGGAGANANGEENAAATADDASYFLLSFKKDISAAAAGSGVANAEDAAGAEVDAVASRETLRLSGSTRACELLLAHFHTASSYVATLEQRATATGERLAVATARLTVLRGDANERLLAAIGGVRAGHIAQREADAAAAALAAGDDRPARRKDVLVCIATFLFGAVAGAAAGAFVGLAAMYAVGSAAGDVAAWACVVGGGVFGGVLGGVVVTTNTRQCQPKAWRRICERGCHARDARARKSRKARQAAARAARAKPAALGSSGVEMQRLQIGIDDSIVGGSDGGSEEARASGGGAKNVASNLDDLRIVASPLRSIIASARASREGSRSGTPSGSRSVSPTSKLTRASLASQAKGLLASHFSSFDVLADEDHSGDCDEATGASAPTAAEKSHRGGVGHAALGDSAAATGAPAPTAAEKPTVPVFVGGVFVGHAGEF